MYEQARPQAKFLIPKKFWVQNILGLKKLVQNKIQKNFQSKKFWVKKIMAQKNLANQNFVQKPLMPPKNWIEKFWSKLG